MERKQRRNKTARSKREKQQRDRDGGGENAMKVGKLGEQKMLEKNRNERQKKKE